MKKILILGAGLVSKPGVTYLLKNKNFSITVASRTLSKAENLVAGYDNGNACQINVENQSELEELIKTNDIIVSLLPWVHHIKVASLCLKNSKHMATTSYVSADMKKLHPEVKAKGLLFLNEIGVDPGIDHMSAMKIIDEVHAEGGKILHFYSYCGGLPAPDDNDNPFGYKFSWSPKGVILASKNPAQYLENGKIVNIEGNSLFAHYRLEDIDELGAFEVYPNRDSMPYRKLYALEEALTVMRGTYRNLGWCDTFKKIVDLGLVDDTPRKNLKGASYRKMMADLIDADADGDVEAKIAEKIGLPKDSAVMQKLGWLGLFSSKEIMESDNPLDILSDLLLKKLIYKDGEKDMIILRHRFIVENKDKSKDEITSTLVDFGIPHGDTSMARTVSLPLAIGVELMAEDKIKLKGVQIPVMKEIYGPVMAKLAELNIKMVERRYQIK